MTRTSSCQVCGKPIEHNGEPAGRWVDPTVLDDPATCPLTGDPHVAGLIREVSG